MDVVCSVVKPDALGDVISLLYGWDSGTVLKLLKTGINHTYLANSNEHKHIVRVYTHAWRSREQIQEELNFCKYLHKQGLSVSYPIPDLNSNYIQDIATPEGLRYVVVWSWADGIKSQQHHEDTHFNAGKWLADLHSNSRGYHFNSRLDLTKPTQWDWAFTEIFNRIEPTHHQWAWLKKLQSQLHLKLNQLPTHLFSTGVIHADFWFDNFHVSETRLTVFDFDFASNGWLAMDVAYYQMQLRSMEPDTHKFESKWSAFMEGYHFGKGHLTPDEVAALPVLGLCLLVFYLGVQCNRFNFWTSSFLNEVYLSRYLEVFIGRQAKIAQLHLD